MPKQRDPAPLADTAGAGGRVPSDAHPTASFRPRTPAARTTNTGHLDAALGYARRGWPVFPCHWQGERRKHPLTDNGFRNATIDLAVIDAWWSRWPNALIGAPTGRAIGAVVLDVDVKRLDANGFDSLADLGCAILPVTPLAHTASRGLHIFFVPPPHREIRNTTGHRGAGIGPGLDWRGEGGFVILPSPDSGYIWDPYWNIDTTELAAVPNSLLPQRTERLASTRPVKPATGLSPYAEAALDGACRRIIAAPNGEQETTLNGEAFAIGTLAGAGAIPPEFAHRVLHWAARQMRNLDPRRPWRTTEIERKVDRAFGEGVRRPRSVGNAA